VENCHKPRRVSIGGSGPYFGLAPHGPHADDWPVKKVLVPVDLSDASGRRFAEAGEFARPPDAIRAEQNS